MTDTTSAAPTYQQVIAAWNAQADGLSMVRLGEDEKVEWAVVCAKTTPPAVVEPLTKEQRRRIVLTADTVSEAIDMVERHHGIKGGQHGTE